MGGVNVDFCLEYTHHFEVLPILLSEESSFLAPCGIVNDENNLFCHTMPNSKSLNVSCLI